ncbi:MAG: ABC transporter permease [Rhodocyclaceae bacterium]|nr:ABC transporter permease [Rhodocyclaceae bacterium]
MTALALRNIVRHRRRTAICIGAIVVGVVALLLAGGFAEWMVWMERESTIHSRLGHLQIVKRGYYESGVADPYAYLVDERAVDTRQIAALAYVKTVTPRLAFAGLISKGDTTLSFLGEGVAPETEALVSREVVVDAGAPLASGDPKGVILGKGLAASLRVAPGDNVVLLVNTRSGGVSAVEVRVRGIFHTAVKAFDDAALRVPIGLARKLMHTGGAHQFIVLLSDTERTNDVLYSLRHLLGQSQPDLQVTPWIDLADFYKAVVDLFSAQTGFVRLIIAVIIVMSISNTLMTNVRERTSEIGTMMAIGFRRRRIIELFVSEGAVMGLLGGALGAILGYLLGEVISAVGIPMPPAPGMDQGFDAKIRVTAEMALGGFSLAVVSAVVASFYPAWKASRIQIVEALRRGI